MKKTVAFSWIHQPVEIGGGIERVTHRLMGGLATRGYRCLFVLHDIEHNRFLHNGTDLGSLATFLSQHHVDTLINQNGYSSSMSEVLRRSNWTGRYLVCHHNEPRYLRKLYDFNRVAQELFLADSPVKVRFAWMARLIAYPIWKKWAERRIGETQKVNYETCINYVLLSQAFLPDLSKLLRRTQVTKATAIPNPLSFEVTPRQATRFLKTNEALIVARLNDSEKRISAALRAWQTVEKSSHSDWRLKIVGDGPDGGALRAMASRLGLRRVEFLGQGDPLPHFKSASLFLMTSRVEGWGLTLTEAMQTGTVPIAFDAYASLRDIIDHEVNGVIVPNGDTNAFAEETIRLMSNSCRLKALASNAIDSSQRYTLEKVLDRWEEIL